MAPSNPLDENTSLEVQGSGRFFFALAKILGDVIDDELQVSDANKCAGKKVDMGKRVLRVAANASSRVSVASSKGKLGSSSSLKDDLETSGALTGALIAGTGAITVAVAGVSAVAEAAAPFLAFAAL